MERSAAGLCHHELITRMVMKVVITYDCRSRRIATLIGLPHSLSLSVEGQFAHRIAPRVRVSPSAVHVKRGWFRQTPRIISRTCATLSVDSNPRGPGVRDVLYSIHNIPLGEHKIGNVT